MADTIRVEILDGGIIKMTSADKISAPNHMAAERLLGAIQKAAGGKVKVTHLKKGHAHTHADGTIHQH